MMAAARFGFLGFCSFLFFMFQVEVFASGASDLPEGTDLQGNTGFSGDGTSLTMLQDAPKIPRTGGGISSPVGRTPNGDASYGFSFKLPPARLHPSIGIGYSSGAPKTREMLLGWSLSGLAEIVKAREPKFVGKNYFRLSGPFGSGLLVPAANPANTWILKGAGVAITAFRASDSSTWTIWTGGVKHILTKVLGTGAEYWRIKSSDDVFTNSVTYTYDTSGRLTKVEYGGTTAATAIAKVELDYVDDALKTTYGAGSKHSAYSKQYGVLEYLDQRLDKVRISANPGSGYAEIYRYKLTTQMMGNREVLQKIQQYTTDLFSPPITRVGFSYQPFLDANQPKADEYTADIISPHVSSTSDTLTEGIEDWTPMSTRYAGVLADFNRDGLPDLIEGGRSNTFLRPEIVTATNSSYLPSASNKWTIRLQVKDQNGPVWANTTTPLTMPIMTAPSETATSGLDVGHGLGKSLTKIADLDGDGYLDLIRTDGVGTTANNWKVYYGLNGGFSSTFTTEKASSGHVHSQVSISVNADTSDNGAPVIAGTMQQELADIDRDGWLDIWVAGGYYRHLGTRAAGFSPTLTTYAFSPGKSVEYTVKNLDLHDHLYDWQYRKKQVDESREIKGWHDLNGDGWSDWVEAPGPTPLGTDWKVFFGGPTGVSTTSVTWAMPYVYNYIEIAKEGSPAIVYNAPNAQPVPPPPATIPPTLPPLPGTPVLKDAKIGIVYQQLIDVDNDGLQDFLVMDPSMTATFGGKWLQNTGGGFGTTWHDVPNWFPQGYFGGGGLGAAANGSSDYLQKTDGRITRNGVIPGGPIGLSISAGGTFTGSISLSMSTTTTNLMDLDADGALDAFDVDVSGGYRDDTAVFGMGDRAFYLIQVKEPDGTQIDLEYESDSKSYPVGMLGNVVQDTPNHHTRLKRLSILDRVTGQTGHTEYSYLAGHESRGEFLGYEYMYEHTYINGVLTKAESSQYDLETEFPAALKGVWSGYDENMCTVPALDAGGGCVPSINLNEGGASSHKNVVAISGFVKTGALNTIKLPSTIDITEYGEVSGSATLRKSLTWGSNGELLTAIIDGNPSSGTNTDYSKVTATYGLNLAKGLILPHTIKFADSAGRTLSDQTRYYDNATNSAVTNGFLTKTHDCTGMIYASGGVCSGWADTLFTQKTRGATGVKTAPTGVTQTFDYSFGYSIPTTITVSSTAAPTTTYVTTHLLDERLRIKESTAPSGVKTFMTYDHFDRPFEESMQGRATGAVKVLLRKHGYQDVSFPNWHSIEGYEMGGTEVYQDFDADGNVTRTWEKSGSNYVRTDFLHDVRGLKIKSAYPLPGQPSHSISVPLAFDQVLDTHYYDGFGHERESYADFSADVGHSYVQKPTPRVGIKIDGEDYRNEVTVNGLGHLTQVRKGKAGTSSTVGTYTYEANGLLKSLTTPKSDQFTYDYDTAGRLRTVNKGVAGQTLSPWYTYAYTGMLPLSRTDNLSPGGYISFSFDSMARLKNTRVSDPLLTFIDYGVEYDTKFYTLPKKYTDATGYDEVGLTGKGEIDSIRRVWTSGGATVLDKKITYESANTGEVTKITYPSGNYQRLNYSEGRLSTRVVHGAYPTSDGQTSRTITYSYGAGFRKLNNVTAGSDYPTLEIKRTLTSTQVDKLIYTANNSNAEVNYTYLDNGMISSKNHLGDLAASGLQDMTYDDVGQLKRIAKAGAGNVFNASFHSDGSLSSYRATDGSVYSYLYPASGTAEANKGLRKPTSRTAGAFTESYLYDLAGRRTSSTKNGVTTNYLYDGVGRVRRVLVGGVPKMDYNYSASEKVVSERANPTTGGSPVYFLGSWRYVSLNNVEIEDYSKFMSATVIPNTLPAPAPAKVWGWVWKFADLDSHVLATYIGTFLLASRETLSPSGETLDMAGLPWDHEAFHGKRYNGNVDLLQIGVRQMTAEDSTWLAPEPALYTGMIGASLNSPLKYSAYRYAGNDSINGADLTGLLPGLDEFLDTFASEYSEAMDVRPTDICKESGTANYKGGNFRVIAQSARQTLMKPVSEGGFGMSKDAASSTLRKVTDPIVYDKLKSGSFKTDTPLRARVAAPAPPAGAAAAAEGAATPGATGVARTPTIQGNTSGAAVPAESPVSATATSTGASTAGKVAGVASNAAFVVTIASFDISDNSSRVAEDPSGAQVGGVVGGWVGGMVGNVPGAVIGSAFGAMLGYGLENREPDDEADYGGERP